VIAALLLTGHHAQAAAVLNVSQRWDDFVLITLASGQPWRFTAQIDDFVSDFQVGPDDRALLVARPHSAQGQVDRRDRVARRRSDGAYGPHRNFS
jgi:hypothetical protein